MEKIRRRLHLRSRALQAVKIKRRYTDIRTGKVLSLFCCNKAR